MSFKVIDKSKATRGNGRGQRARVCGGAEWRDFSSGSERPGESVGRQGRASAELDSESPQAGSSQSNPHLKRTGPPTDGLRKCSERGSGGERHRTVGTSCQGEGAPPRTRGRRDVEGMGKVAGHGGARGRGPGPSEGQRGGRGGKETQGSVGPKEVTRDKGQELRLGTLPVHQEGGNRSLQRRGTREEGCLAMTEKSFQPNAQMGENGFSTPPNRWLAVHPCCPSTHPMPLPALQTSHCSVLCMSHTKSSG